MRLLRGVVNVSGMNCSDCDKAREREYHSSVDCLGERDACEAAKKARCPTHVDPPSFEARCAEFLAGLQALTERTGIVALVSDDRDFADEYSGGITLIDRVAIRQEGGYECLSDIYVSWENARTEEQKAAQEERVTLLSDVQRMTAELARPYVDSPNERAKRNVINDKWARIHAIDKADRQGCVTVKR